MPKYNNLGEDVQETYKTVVDYVYIYTQWFYL